MNRDTDHSYLVLTEPNGNILVNRISVRDSEYVGALTEIEKDPFRSVPTYVKAQKNTVGNNEQIIGNEERVGPEPGLWNFCGKNRLCLIGPTDKLLFM